MIKIGKNISDFSTYSCKPKTRDELRDIIRKRIREQGPNCDLNDIDVQSCCGHVLFVCLSSIQR